MSPPAVQNDSESLLGTHFSPDSQMDGTSFVLWFRWPAARIPLARGLRRGASEGVSGGVHLCGFVGAPALPAGGAPGVGGLFGV